MLGFLRFSDQEREQDAKCRTKPLACLGQIGIDAAVIVLVWWVLSYVARYGFAHETKMPTLMSTAVFLAGYVFLSWLTRAMNLEFQDKFNVAAGFQMGYKLFSLMSGGMVR